jgi:hypothetical protein
VFGALATKYLNGNMWISLEVPVGVVLSGGTAVTVKLIKVRFSPSPLALKTDNQDNKVIRRFIVCLIGV